MLMLLDSKNILTCEGVGALKTLSIVTGHHFFFLFRVRSRFGHVALVEVRVVE